MLRGAMTVTFLVGLTGCWIDFPDERFKAPEAKVHIEEPDRRIGDLQKCAADQLIACTPDKKGIIKCNPTGAGTVTVNCAPYVCQDPAHRCNACNPTDPPICDMASSVSCNRFGLQELLHCSHGCKDGKCQ